MTPAAAPTVYGWFSGFSISRASTARMNLLSSWIPLDISGHRLHHLFEHFLPRNPVQIRFFVLTNGVTHRPTGQPDI